MKFDQANNKTTIAGEDEHITICLALGMFRHYIESEKERGKEADADTERYYQYAKVMLNEFSEKVFDGFNWYGEMDKEIKKQKGGNE